MKPEDLDNALYATDPVLRDGARGRLIREAKEEEIATLLDLLDAPQRRTRRRTARILSEIHPDRVRLLLERALLDAARPPRVRMSAARVLSVLCPEGVEALGAALVDPEVRVRRASATPSAPIPALVAALGDEDGQVAERAAEALEALRHQPEAEALEVVARRSPPLTPALARLLARVDERARALIAAAQLGDPTALDHLGDEATLLGLLGGEHRQAAAWGLARIGGVPPELAEDPDPRTRAAAARALPPDHPALAALIEDPDPGVAWLARKAQAGAYEPELLRRRIGPHARSDAASARPPYGIRPEDELPEVARAEAALTLCHTRFDINLGVAVRSAEAAGLREVFLLGRGDLFRSPARGTDLLLPIQVVPDPAALIRAAREGGYQIVVVQQTPDSVSYIEADYPPRPLFVMGAEDSGVPEPLRLAADLVVEIPMFGVIDSLNVAAAATTVMLYWRAQLEAR